MTGGTFCPAWDELNRGCTLPAGHADLHVNHMGSRFTSLALDQLMTERLDLLAEAEKTKARLDDNAAALLPLLTAAGGRAELPGLPGQGFTVAAGRATFSADRLRAIVGDQRMAELSVFPPSSKAQAAEVIPGALLEQCMVSSGKPSLRKMSERRG